jgi:hypothetical protein
MPSNARAALIWNDVIMLFHLQNRINDISYPYNDVKNIIVQAKAFGARQNAIATARRGTTRPAKPKALSSEVGAGSRQENASNKEIEPPFRFNRNGKGSTPRRDGQR